MNAYIIIDIGTGNVRVAATSTNGEVLAVAREDLAYCRDGLYPEALYFDPDQLWTQVSKLFNEVVGNIPDINVKAFTATSQREGIVLLSKDGRSLIGLPNIDHRGREWERMLTDKSMVYRLTGRYPTSLFSAFKLLGVKERRKDVWDHCATFLSISDWVEYKLSGVIKYEHSQASETLLYDVAAARWSEELCDVFGLNKSLLPPLVQSGTIIGKAIDHPDAVVIAGGGDTQLAIKSTQPTVDDVVIVSGTTTPIVKLIDEYRLDDQERTWTSRDIDPARLVFEANAGVTGLNFQRLKEVFYPNEGYDVIERELAQINDHVCTASLGSLIADEKSPLIRGGFIFPTPVSHQLTRAHFVWATMVDIACSIAENFMILGTQKDYVWACGGGLQSKTLRQLLAGLINKKVQVRHGFEHSSVIGGALLCNEVLDAKAVFNDTIEVVSPTDTYTGIYKQWKQTRAHFKTL